MEKRILNQVQADWGRGTVYTYDPLGETEILAMDTKPKPPERPSVVALRQSISTTKGISQAIVHDIEIPDAVTAIPIEGFSYMLSALFAAVLEDVMGQMWILERCNNELCILKTMADMDHLKAMKYGVWDPNVVKDELDGIDPGNLNCVIYKIKKLDADRKYLNTVLLATYLSLAQTYTFRPLITFNDAIETRDRYRFQLEEEENKNKLQRKELGKQLRQQRIHIRTVLYDTEVIIDKLRTQVEDSVLYSEVRGRYVDNWQNARTEQHNQKIYYTENKPASTIELYKQRSDHEVRIHTEVESLVGIAITETLTKVEEWMDKYEIDIEAIDLKIQIKKNDYQNMKEKRIDLEETIKRHDVEMENWIAFKDAREKERAYREKMETSAIIVQAWWRGLLVRLQLGPYRPKKQKKAPKKKK